MYYHPYYYGLLIDILLYFIFLYFYTCFVFFWISKIIQNGISFFIAFVKVLQAFQDTGLPLLYLLNYYLLLFVVAKRLYTYPEAIYNLFYFDMRLGLSCLLLHLISRLYLLFFFHFFIFMFSGILLYRPKKYFESFIKKKVFYSWIVIFVRTFKDTINKKKKGMFSFVPF